MLLWFVFGVFGIVPEVLKMFVWVFVGWRILVYLGLEVLGVFVFLVFVFVFLCCFCFCFVCFVFVLLLDCFWCWFLFCFCFCLFSFLFFLFSFVFVFFFVSFVFFGGFKGQVRWPKGPLPLALNPRYCFVFVFFVLFFLEGQRATSLGPKPSLFSFSFFCFFAFLSLFYNRPKNLFSP